MQQTPASAALGGKIAEYRKARGWSQSDLAAKMAESLGTTVDPTTITRLEKGTRPLPVHELLLLAKLFEVDPALLLQTGDPLDEALADAQAEVGAMTDAIRQAQERLAVARAGLVPLQHLLAYRKHGRDQDFEAALASGLTRRANWQDILYALNVPIEEVGRIGWESMTSDEQSLTYWEANRD